MGSKESPHHLPSAKPPEDKYVDNNDDHDDVQEVDDEDLGRGDVIKSGHPFVRVEVFLQPSCAGNLLEKVKHKLKGLHFCSFLFDIRDSKN